VLQDWQFLQVSLKDECRFVSERSLTQRAAMLTSHEAVSNDVARISDTDRDEIFVSDFAGTLFGFSEFRDPNSARKRGQRIDKSNSLTTPANLRVLEFLRGMERAVLLSSECPRLVRHTTIGRLGFPGGTIPWWWNVAGDEPSEEQG
jgi:hypothetical protein